MIKQTDLARLAAFLDGEGCITITFRHRKKRSAVYHIYQPHVVISNSDKRLIDWLEHTFGGWISKLQPKYPNSKLMYTWHMNNVRELLSKVYPYLVLKREQAKILMDFPLPKSRNGARTEKEKLEQERAYQKIRKLNKMGVMIE